QGPQSPLFYGSCGRKYQHDGAVGHLRAIAGRDVAPWPVENRLEPAELFGRGIGADPVVFGVQLAAAVHQGNDLGEGFILLRSEDRKSTRLNSSHVKISYAVFSLKKK